MSTPNLTRDYDMDGMPVGRTLAVGWDVSFGCRVNFGPSVDGDHLRVSVHVSDKAQRDGVATIPTNAAQLRRLAFQLEQVADAWEAER